MRKVIIVGVAGSGKSTLAKRISKKINARHIELDSIYHQQNWQPIETEEFIKTINEFMENDSWVFCGNYFSRLGLEFWSKADTVIWLDYPFHTALRRVFLRTLKRGLTRQVLWNGNRESLRKNLFTKDSVIRHMLTTWRKQKKRYEPIFLANKLGDTTLIKFTNDSQANEFVQSL